MRQIDDNSFSAGVKAARADALIGRLAYRWRGHAGHWGHWVATQLAARFGVGVTDRFGVCFVANDSLAFDEGYNTELAAEVNRRHGPGAFEAVFSQAPEQSEDVLLAARKAWLEQKSKH